MEINYSVVIRTIGKAGEKYQKLLTSIERLEPKPIEVIVVLPEGYALPKERIGSGLEETFIYCKKGMVEQRLVGIENAKGEYLFVCDDDVMFDKDFIQRLYKPLNKGIAKISAAPLISFLPQPGIRSIYNNISSSAVQTIFNKNKYVHILKSSGWSYNRNLDFDNEVYYETESLPWTCFFAEKKALDSINFRSEIWLDKYGYASMDDQAMFYKAYLMGIKSVVVSNAKYIHMDAMTSRKEDNKIADRVFFASGFNRFVFWYRFIYCNGGFILKCLSISSFLYYILFNTVYLTLKGIKNKEFIRRNKLIYKGYREAKKYIKTSEYKSLEKINFK